MTEPVHLRSLRNCEASADGDEVAVGDRPCKREKELVIRNAEIHL